MPRCWWHGRKLWDLSASSIKAEITFLYYCCFSQQFKVPLTAQEGIVGVIILFSQTQCPTLSHYKRRYHLSQCITFHSFEISTLVRVLWRWMRYVNMQPSPVAVSLPPFFPILPSPASTHPLLPSLPPKIALGLAHGQPNARICRYMTWMLLWQWLKRHVCQQAAHTYSCIVLSRAELNAFFLLLFCLAWVLSSHDCKALPFHMVIWASRLRWALCVFSGWNQFCPPREKYIKLVAKCVFPKGSLM